MTIMSPSKLVPTKRNFSLGSLELSNNNFYFDHRINDEIGGQETKDKLCEH